MTTANGNGRFRWTPKPGKMPSDRLIRADVLKAAQPQTAREPPSDPRLDCGYWSAYLAERRRRAAGSQTLEEATARLRLKAARLKVAELETAGALFTVHLDSTWSIACIDEEEHAAFLDGYAAEIYAVLIQRVAR